MLCYRGAECLLCTSSPRMRMAPQVYAQSFTQLPFPCPRDDILLCAPNIAPICAFFWLDLTANVPSLSPTRYNHQPHDFQPKMLVIASFRQNYRPCH